MLSVAVSLLQRVGSHPTALVRASVDPPVGAVLSPARREVLAAPADSVLVLKVEGREGRADAAGRSSDVAEAGILCKVRPTTTSAGRCSMRRRIRFARTRRPIRTMR